MLFLLFFFFIILQGGTALKGSVPLLHKPPLPFGFNYATIKVSHEEDVYKRQVYGPDFEPVAELLARKGCSPTIICESAGTQAEDAKIMKDIYLAALQRHEKE